MGDPGNILASRSKGQPSNSERGLGTVSHADSPETYGGFQWPECAVFEGEGEGVMCAEEPGSHPCVFESSEMPISTNRGHPDEHIFPVRVDYIRLLHRPTPQLTSVMGNEP